MVERHDCTRMITLFCSGPFAAGDVVRLGAEPAQHARARRVSVGESARLLDGRGRVATAEITDLKKDAMVVTVRDVVELPRPMPLEVIVPVADRDRMLMAAEKCAELQVTAWRPAYFARSRSVSPRGEGERFRDKVRARMQSALEQSGGAWLPELHDEADVSDVMSGILPQRQRLLLDSRGTSMQRHISNVPLVIAIGPEGGCDQGEIDAAKEGGWILASIGETTLRFETAVIAAVAVVRATQIAGSVHGN